MSRLDGKIALVTGAAQGIGRAIVEAFAGEGARVIAADIRPEKLRNLPPHPAIEVQVLDVADPPAIKAAALRRKDVNVLVNCAGYVATGSILTATPADLERSYQLNVGSVFSMTQAFLPAMLERKNGSIINIASVVSTVKADDDRCAFATSKGAVIALTKSIALDLIKHGIRCNAISPGTVHTPSLDERMSAQADPKEALRQFVARQPMGRLGEAREIAALAVLLASEEAAFMTGSNLVIDGGFSL
jgi:NAD(P)-dependent dehydrogenase (short-subunit alcohol dehydrogenase family)